MRANLQLRLFAVAALAIVAALAVVGLLSRQAARTEFRRYEVMEGAERLREVAQSLAARLQNEDATTTLDSLLGELGRRARRDLLLVAPDGQLLAASTPALRAARVSRGPDGALTIEQERRRDGLTERTRALLHGGPYAEVRRGDGSVLGTLILLPSSDDESPQRRAVFGVGFDRRLLLAAAFAGVVALALTWWLSRRILEPVTALTHAAARLGRGDLSQRVAVRGHDELADLSRAFNAMAESLGRQEALRRTLVTDVAHELRTPLTNLRCQIEAVEDGLLAPTPDTVRSLREEVLRLTHLVEDLQTLSVAEAGRLALDRSPLGVRDLVEGAVERFAAQAAARNVTLRAEVPELPAVLADPARIGQVLGNLLANALTHTPEGGTVVVGAGERDGAVVISVSDSGPGIETQHLPHVFERFYRADPSRARATGGAGLGLAIVKGIVEAHGGSVEALSPPGGGAVLRFSLPGETRRGCCAQVLSGLGPGAAGEGKNGEGVPQ